VFALKSILFLADNYISFNACAIPADMLLLQLQAGNRLESD
jgi:hypothetical protein